MTTFNDNLQISKMSTICLSEVKVYGDPAPIEVRVLKKWIPYHDKKYIYYLFVDAHGCAIEATTSTNNKAHFDSVITIQSCYIIDDYVCLSKRPYMPTVGHDASIRLGMIATFTPSSNNNIPDHYFDFATYNELMPITKLPKRLTDFIGRVIDDKHKPVKSTTLRKIIIIDEDMISSETSLELTLWPNHNVKAPDKTNIGSIIAITSAEVKEYMGKYVSTK
ncbi:uncharacterized protein LOC143565771 [Bidens hawaiensis]|uniref:uncharacterized protein LOC143565771 n=1 Tax=Bidens hawaiensis TaxID=980011 RepID=UPI00404AB44A